MWLSSLEEFRRVAHSIGLNENIVSILKLKRKKKFLFPVAEHKFMGIKFCCYIFFNLKFFPLDFVYFSTKEAIQKYYKIADFQQPGKYITFDTFLFLIF